jgi:hypothetical protein
MMVELRIGNNPSPRPEANRNLFMPAANTMRG